MLVLFRGREIRLTISGDKYIILDLIVALVLIVNGADSREYEYVI